MGGLLASQWNFPLISYGGTNKQLTKYDTYTPTLSQDANMAKVFRGLAEKFNWNHIGIYKAKVTHLRHLVPAMEKNFKPLNITHTETHLYNNMLMFSDVPALKQEHLEKMKIMKGDCRGKSNALCFTLLLSCNRCSSQRFHSQWVIRQLEGFSVSLLKNFFPAGKV